MNFLSNINPNILYVVLGLSQVGLILYVTRKQRREKKAGKDQARSFEHYRGKALQVTHEQLMLPIPAGETWIYGLVMDWNINGSIVTLTAFITGEANLYVSTGGGITGAGRHLGVSEAVQAMLLNARLYLDNAHPSPADVLPGKDTVGFSLLTNKGKYTAQELVQNLENATSVWTGLFEEARGVINVMRGS